MRSYSSGCGNKFNDMVHPFTWSSGEEGVKQL